LRYTLAVYRLHGGHMAEKLGIGDSMPAVTINLVDGSTLDLPAGLDARYKVILFYRGHW
jgi:peroxiredoxin